MADEHKTRLNSQEVYNILATAGVLTDRHKQNHERQKMDIADLTGRPTNLADIAQDMNPHAQAMLLENLKKAVIQLKTLHKYHQWIVKRFGKQIKANDETGDLTAYMFKEKLYIDEYTPANHTKQPVTGK